jgi:hypothetical protein
MQWRRCPIGGRHAKKRHQLQSPAACLDSLQESQWTPRAIKLAVLILPPVSQCAPFPIHCPFLILRRILKSVGADFGPRFYAVDSNDVPVFPRKKMMFCRGKGSVRSHCTCSSGSKLAIDRCYCGGFQLTSFVGRRSL